MTNVRQQASEERRRSIWVGLGLDRLAQRRQALGLTQQALADLVGVGVVEIWRWESGRVCPYPDYYVRLEAALGQLERSDHAT